MQFQNPEILYFLALLIIPILIHLFQLQKFEKTPFTNVAFLKRITQDNRKSSRLKKWLILATRLLLFSAILFAFTQPYFSNKKENNTQHTFIYLDNSLSLNTKGERGNLLKIAAHKIIDNASKEDVYSLQTNLEFRENISFDELKKELLKVENTTKSLDLETILLKTNQIKKNKTNTLYKNILISDFQNINNDKFTNVTGDFSLIQLNSSIKDNISIDSIYIGASATDNLELNVVINNQGEPKDNVPIAIYNDEKLLSKQSFSIAENSIKTISFSLQQKENIKGKIAITSSDTFTFDNSYFFSINETKKINVLTIGKAYDFYSKIYTKNEFNYKQTSLQNLDYNSFTNQELIILNELLEIPDILSRSLLNYLKSGGSLVIIPNPKLQINSYRRFFNSFSNFRISSIEKDSTKITNINFDHPIFKNVFAKKVSNFQYPVVKEYFKTNGKNVSPIINFANKAPFAAQITSANQNIYWLSSSLSQDISNFSKSPLIVPLFYNFGKLSFKHSQLYYSLDKNQQIDIDVKLAKDEILTIANSNLSFIPQQRSYQNKVTLNIEEEITKAGFYSVIHKKDTIQTLAFNNPNSESSLNYLDINTLKKNNSDFEIYNSVEDALTTLNKKNEVQWLWKWFLALAIVSLLAEILILKFYKP